MSAQGETKDVVADDRGRLYLGIEAAHQPYRMQTRADRVIIVRPFVAAFDGDAPDVVADDRGRLNLGLEMAHRSFRMLHRSDGSRVIRPLILTVESDAPVNGEKSGELP